MRILLNTALKFFPAGEEAVAIRLDEFDPTFSRRYLMPEKSLRGEGHYESDKYHIFYLEGADEKVAPLLAYLKTCSWCRVVGAADESYCLKGEPLYQSDSFQAHFKTVPRNIRVRPEGFTPR